MKALVIDDEAKAREMLLFLLENYLPEIEEVRLAKSADHADEMLKSFEPDLVFLDIKMPGKDGFTWLKHREKHSFAVIFTTAHDEYAIRAIRFSAFDYLLKPIDAQDLRSAFDRFQGREKKLEPPYDNLFYNASQKDEQAYRLTISTVEGTYYLKPIDIIRCEGDGNYTLFFTTDDRKIIASRPVGHFEDLLEPVGFIRCHKSHLVNPRYVLKHSEAGLSFSENIVIEVSRRRRKIVKEKLQKFSRRAQ